MTVDALVIGGGPAGNTVATFLAKAGWDVALVEKSAFPRQKVCGEFISAATHPLFEALGIGSQWTMDAGPLIKQVALFAGDKVIDAPMPLANSGGSGRAHPRSTLDKLMIDNAESSGVAVYQPWKATRLIKTGSCHTCQIESGATHETIVARVVIAAHGSWELGGLPTQLPKQNRPSDLLAFKFLFNSTGIEQDHMPLLAFPGGYGGMVHVSHGVVGLSCCIRRDVLEEQRHKSVNSTAAMAVLDHIRATTTAVDEFCRGAELTERPLAVGPIRPGIRKAYAHGIFRVGNVAGESHPIIAEGISMAMQGAALLADVLIHDRVPSNHWEMDLSGETYAQRWRDQFSGRIRAANLFSSLAMNRFALRYLTPILKVAPRMLTIGAELSGKAKPLPQTAVSRLSAIGA